MCNIFMIQKKCMLSKEDTFLYNMSPFTLVCSYTYVKTFKVKIMNKQEDDEIVSVINEIKVNRRQNRSKRRIK